MSNRITVLSGGVGGAKLVLGLSQLVPGERLTVVANTGDDFEHLGLYISPDLDTLMYTLAGEVNTKTGWGRKNETWQFMDALDRLDGETWFRLGDRDLATHAERTRLLSAGHTLTEITARFCERLGVNTRILPMSNDRMRTRVETDDGRLDFQHYFVRDRAQPRVNALTFDDAATARPGPGVTQALVSAETDAIIIAPSNPYLSIDPILAITALRDAIGNAGAPVVAISPIVGNAAIKGPTAKIMTELGLEVSAVSIARHYGDLLDGFILDATDRDMAEKAESMGLEVTICDTIMNSLDDKVRLAQVALDFAASLAANKD
jgi:LPPG:FO 2-phospho-L-lactate transferase